MIPMSENAVYFDLWHHSVVMMRNDDVQGCHDALIEWIEGYEHVAVSQQSVVIILHVRIHCTCLHTTEVLKTSGTFY